MNQSKGLIGSVIAAVLFCASATVTGGPLTGQTLSGAGAGLSPATAVVGAGVEFKIDNDIDIDIDENGLVVLTVRLSTDIGFGGVTGYVFTDVNGTIPDITGFDVVSLGANTQNFGQHNLAFTANSFSVTFFDVTEILVNGEPNSLQLSFARAAVPEPASLALLGLGLAGLGWSRRRK